MEWRMEGEQNEDLDVLFADVLFADVVLRKAVLFVLALLFVKRTWSDRYLCQGELGKHPKMLMAGTPCCLAMLVVSFQLCNERIRRMENP